MEKKGCDLKKIEKRMERPLYEETNEVRYR
jgi:hypothetical protein